MITKHFGSDFPSSRQLLADLNGVLINSHNVLVNHFFDWTFGIMFLFDQLIRNNSYIYYETKKYIFFNFCFQDYPRLQPTDTFLNIGGIQIPKNNLAENKKALDEMSPVKKTRNKFG